MGGAEDGGEGAAMGGRKTTAATRVRLRMLGVGKRGAAATKGMRRGVWEI